MATLDGPMVVVTATGGATRAGCLVGFHTQVSIDPARYLVCLSKKNHTYAVAAQATHLAIHFLRHDQLELAATFGTRCGALVDKFASAETTIGPAGSIIVRDCAHWFVGAVIGSLDLGDHVAFGLEPLASGGDVYDGPLLSFQDVKHLDAAHAP